MKRRFLPLLFLATFFGAALADFPANEPRLAAAEPALAIDTPLPPPDWALLERELLTANAAACREYFDRYFDSRGYLECVERWGGDDGPDDAIENVNDWPVLHALGADDAILQLVHKAWEGHLRQYTLARTTDVEFARDGMYYKEFPVMFDWLHNGEGLTVFNLMGLSSPANEKLQARVRRFAGFYLNEDPQARNYDPRHKIIRSLFNGSRGPLMRRATGLDWAGDPIEIEGRFRPGHGEKNYAEMLEHFRDYNDILGDHPQNLLATSLALNAYMLAHEAKYKDWVLEYAGAWRDRTSANNGIVPTNIGRDGTIGGECQGKWYGGVYGWGFTVAVPGGNETANRNTHHLGLTGFGNALLLTGDQSFVDVWRRQIDAVNAQGKTIDGQTMYPTMYGDQGWYGFTPQEYAHGALEVFYWSMDEADRSRVSDNGWLKYLAGENPDYPATALRGDFAAIRAKVAGMRADPTTPDTRLADDPMQFNPAAVGTLVNLMLGGLQPGRVGGPLHSRLRYFDPVGRRAGIPPDVAALVDKLSADSVSVTLVNLSQTEPREVVVQAGAYGEHEFTQVEFAGQKLPAESPLLTVRLAPGAGGRLTLGTRRYANPPTLMHPWARTSAK